jgi:hypothetical protein
MFDYCRFMARESASRRHEEWVHKSWTLPDGRNIRWTVDELPGKGPTIVIVWVGDSPCWLSAGRDLLRDAGHPDGCLPTTVDLAPGGTQPRSFG